MPDLEGRLFLRLATPSDAADCIILWNVGVNGAAHHAEQGIGKEAGALLVGEREAPETAVNELGQFALRHQRPAHQVECVVEGDGHDLNHRHCLLISVSVSQHVKQHVKQ